MRIRYVPAEIHAHVGRTPANRKKSLPSLPVEPGISLCTASGFFIILFSKASNISINPTSQPPQRQSVSVQCSIHTLPTHIASTRRRTTVPKKPGWMGNLTHPFRGWNGMNFPATTVRNLHNDDDDDRGNGHRLVGSCIERLW